MKWSDLILRLKVSLDKIWLSLAFVLVSILSYEAGSIHQALAEPRPVVIEVPDTLPAPSLPERQSAASGVVPASTDPSIQALDCAFVGSQRSNKYHLPASRCAKQIKAENRVCFASVDAALAKGYVAGCLE